MYNLNSLKKNSYSYNEVRLVGEGKVFGNEAPKLPIDNMLMIDSILDINENGGEYRKGFIKAKLNIDPDNWFFKCHFKDDPVMPGCLGLDALWQLIGFFLAWNGAKGKGRALGVGNVKFSGQVLPHIKEILYVIDIKKVINRQFTFGIADGKVKIDDKIIYTANDLKVGVFQGELF